MLEKQELFENLDVSIGEHVVVWILMYLADRAIIP